MAFIIGRLETVDRRGRRSDLAGKLPLAETGLSPHIVNQLSRFNVDEPFFKLFLRGCILTNQFIIQFLNRGRIEFLFVGIIGSRIGFRCVDESSVFYLPGV